MTEMVERTDQIEFPFSGQATFEDFKRAHAMKAAAAVEGGKKMDTRKKKGLQKIQTVIALVLLGGIGLGVLFIISMVNWRQGGSPLTPVIGVIAVVSVVAFLFGRFRRQGLHNAWKKQEYRLERIRGTVLRDAIVFETDYSTARMKWPNFIGYDHDGVVLIFSDDELLFRMVTKAMFRSEEEWHTVVGIVRENLPRHSGEEEGVEAPAANCSVCKRGFPKTAMIELGGNWSCAGCKDIAAQKLREGVA